MNHPGVLITVATTRPETTLGDVAIAVNPSDSRYSQLIGQRVEHPITRRLLPIIADKAVHADKGSGALKGNRYVIDRLLYLLISRLLKSMYIRDCDASFSILDFCMKI